MPTPRRQFLKQTVKAAAAVSLTRLAWCKPPQVEAPPIAAAAVAPTRVSDETSACTPTADASLSAELRLARDRFDVWLRHNAVATAPEVEGLVYNFYDTDAAAAEWLFPLLNGKACLYHLAHGRVLEAEQAVRAALRHQQLRRDGAWARTYGAFPSVIERDAAGDWVAGDRYYSGDALCLVEALVALFEVTGKDTYLEGALAAGTWVKSVMCRGQDYGVWAEDHGAPMHFATSEGGFSNAIHTGTDALWISALTRLGALVDEPAFAAQAERAWAFYATAQRPDGAFMNHYDPGWPAQPFDAARWQPFGPATAVNPEQLVADTHLRTALGAARLGRVAEAEAALAWLTVESGGVPGYLDLGGRGHAFIPSDAVYYDVVSSGLLRALCRALGRAPDAAAAEAFLVRTQHGNGGWHWGAMRDGLGPVTPDQAAIIGFWATADLAEPICSGGPSRA